MRSIIKKMLLRLFAFFFRDDGSKVVFYHDIGRTYTNMGTPAEVFYAHMKCLREGDVVCFDDGFRGVWDERDRLKAEISKNCKNTRVIIFVAVDLMGKTGYITWDEIRILQEVYKVEFGCHTWSHQTLIGPWNSEVPIPEGGRTEEWYKHELIDSKVELERRLNHEVTNLCFPVGYFSDDIIRRCRDAGYQKVYASYPGNVTSDYIQPRCLVQDMSVVELRNVLRGGMNILRHRYLKKHKVI